MMKQRRGLAWAAAALLAAIVGGPAASSGVRLPVHFSAPRRGFVSLALYDKNGVLTRSLLYAAPVTPGRHTLDWDGTTDMGKPAAPGTYTARGVFFTAPPALKPVMEVGKSGSPPWRTADGKGDWGANMGAPTSIVSNGNSVISAYVAVEDNQITGIQQMDGSGSIQKRYYSFYPWDTRMAAAMDATSYYLGILNTDKKQIEIAAYALGEPRGKILTALPTRPHRDESETRWRGRWTAWLDGLALTKDTLYASVAQDDALFIIDRATGRIRRQIAVPAPRGLAVSQGHLLAVSGKEVLRFTLDGQQETPCVPEGVLTAPSALAVDGAGALYVADSGAAGTFGPRASGGSRQVCVFAPDGKLLRRIGKPGGTPPEGRFDPNGLGVITGLCVGPGTGGAAALWVQDVATGFFRTSRWSLDGHLQRQWFGRRLSLFSDSLNPARPDELVYTSDAFSDEPGITAYHLDWAHKTWQPAWHYDEGWADMFQKDVYLSYGHGGNPLNSAMGSEARWPTFDYASRNFVSSHGRDYFMNSGGNGDGAIFIYSADHKPVPVALVGNHRVSLESGKLQGFYDQGPNNWFTWADRNGDGRMSMDEVTWTEDPPLLAHTSRLSECRLDDHLNVHIKRFVTVDGQARMADSLLPLKELLPNGVPVYDWGRLRDLAPLQAPDLTGGDGAKKVAYVTMPLPLETADAFYSMVNPESEKPLNLPGIDGQGWWAGRNWRTKVARFDKKTGRCLWAVGRRAPGRAEPGQMYHPCWLAGVAGDALFVTDTLGPVWVWNTDGLFLGHLYHDFNEGMEDDQVLYGEIQATGIYTDPQTGAIYSLANDTGAHIHEVVLPKTQPVTGGAVTLSAARAAQAQSWDPDGVAPTEKPAYALSPVGKTVLPITIDGSLDGREGWDQTPDGKPRPEMLVLLDGRRLARVRGMYDAENLYLAYEVEAPSGLLNSGSELPYAPFVSGAYVDFTLGPDWAGPRGDVREGDMRVILARIKTAGGDRNFQQGFWQKKAGGENPRTITSPAAQVHFDQIAPVPGLQMACKSGEADPKTGLTSYTVEVAVPLASLGLQNPSGKSIGFDVSVGVANAAGDRRERAAHWGGLSEAVVVDRPGSTRLLPDTWGTLTFGPKAPETTQQP